MNKIDPTKQNEMFTFGFRVGNSISSQVKGPKVAKILCKVMQSKALR